MIRKVQCIGLLVLLLCGAGANGAEPVGYYRQPAIFRSTIVFVAEGNLWTVSADGGAARRLTSERGEEAYPAISPDGRTVAFIGHYEGPGEVYTMPIGGGLPVRRTYDGESVAVAGWTRDGRVLCATRAGSTLPDVRLQTLDVSAPPVASTPEFVPLAQAADGCYDAEGRVLFFTRLRHQGSATKRYQGGTAQNIWKFAPGDAEATALTTEFPGTSKNPMFWAGRVYFACDRDGTMNIWSMTGDGKDWKQHTHHNGWDVASPSLSEGRIVYQLGADLQLYDIAADKDRRLEISLESDFDQTREHWVKKPIEYLTSSHISPSGERVSFTARGRVFVAPRREGRFVEVPQHQGVRCNDVRFLPDGECLLGLSDESGEFEFWRIPASGIGDAAQLTRDGDVLRLEGVPSPDRKFIAHYDKARRLFVLDLETKQNRLIDQSDVDVFSDLRWSPDGKWLAYAAPLANQFRQVRVYGVTDAVKADVTTDRYDSFSPVFSTDGKWLFLLSDRNLKSVVDAPWGTYQPEPFFDKKTLIYAVALAHEDTRSPFAPPDELHAPPKPEPSGREPRTRPAGPPESQPASRPVPAHVKIELPGIQSRLIKLPMPPGNYSDLAANEKSLFWRSTPAGEKKSALMGITIGHEETEPKTIATDILSFELCQDGTKLLIVKGENGDMAWQTKVNGVYVIDAAVAPADLNKKQIDLSAWSLSVNPREEWRGMFVDAWRMERDYFYDKNMHGVDWRAVRAKYEPLVERVTTRGELSDLIAQMVSELSALHTFVRGGDLRKSDDQIALASLGAELRRDAGKGGYQVTHVYRSDPDEPEMTSPLAALTVNVKEGDVIEQVNGRPTLAEPDVACLLRLTAGRQVRLRVKPADGGAARDVIVTPISTAQAADRRYREWEYTRRLRVEQAGGGKIGYVHLRAMGDGDIAQWARQFYPVWDRQGLILDVRHNGGGDIDSWILGRLLRKAWFFWSNRATDFSTWNMPYAFRGHLVVLCDEATASDGEAFTEGVKRLKLGTVIGKRTWGGEIWLSFDNVLVDKGIASAAENGVFGPERQWLIEGHGVDPDIPIDNPPHATFMGEDAQLDRAVALLQRQIQDDPVKEPKPPAYPDKSFGTLRVGAPRAKSTADR